MRDAIQSALKNEDKEIAETRWSDALSWAESSGNWGGVRFGARLVDSRIAHIEVPAEIAFIVISRIGGDTGWHYGNWLWRLRGFLDLLVGGVGDVLDFWRVEAIEPNPRLRLAAEMKVPGRAWLEFEVEGDETDSTIRQTSLFDPVGLWGLAYWSILYPVHELVFGGMLSGIVASCKREIEPTVSVV